MIINKLAAIIVTYEKLYDEEIFHISKNSDVNQLQGIIERAKKQDKKLGIKATYEIVYFKAINE